MIVEKHALERYLDVARYLGAKDPAPACSLLFQRKLKGCGTGFQRSGKRDERLVVINPVARWNTKLWLEQISRNSPTDSFGKKVLRSYFYRQPGRP